jgi:actin-like ATPase involved in cell morphogenesis
MPTELSSDLVDRRIMLADGGSMIRQLDCAIAEARDWHIIIADDLPFAVANGTGTMW